MVAWTLVFHLIGLVFWLGSLLAVTHIMAAEAGEDLPAVRARLRRLASKLMRGLAHPGAAIMIITGVLLVAQNPHYLRQHWLHAKLLLVAVLIGLDLRVYKRAGALGGDKAGPTRRECTAYHGAISLVFFLILILVLLKPFGLGAR